MNKKDAPRFALQVRVLGRSNTQLVRLPASKSLKLFIRSAAKKLKLKKSAQKTAKLFHDDGSKRVLESLDDLTSSSQLLLCTADEWGETAAATTTSATTTSATTTSSTVHVTKERRLPQLPEDVWGLIAEAFCEMVRSDSDSWLQARLRHLQKQCKDRQQMLHVPVQDLQRRFQWKAAGKSSSLVVPNIPCRQAIVLSMLNKRWHRIIGSSPHLDLLGSWFYKIEEHGETKWIPYSMEANWDLEIGRLLGKEDITVAVCERKQELPGGGGGRGGGGGGSRGKKIKHGGGRRKHVRIHLKEMFQCNIKRASRGKRYEIKRLPTNVLL